jgi:hypothetical protein
MLHTPWYIDFLLTQANICRPGTPNSYIVRLTFQSRPDAKRLQGASRFLTQIFVDTTKQPLVIEHTEVSQHRRRWRRTKNNSCGVLLFPNMLTWKPKMGYEHHYTLLKVLGTRLQYSNFLCSCSRLKKHDAFPSPRASSFGGG